MFEIIHENKQKSRHESQNGSKKRTYHRFHVQKNQDFPFVIGLKFSK